MQVWWLAAFGCLPAAHYLSESGPWVGMNRKTTNWFTMILYLSTLVILLYMQGLGLVIIVLLISAIGIGRAILADNTLNDARI